MKHYLLSIYQPDGAPPGCDAMQHRMVMAPGPATGQLSLDERFREEGATEPGFRVDDKTWPHGGHAKGIPHGAVFSLP